MEPHSLWEACSSRNWSAQGYFTPIIKDKLGDISSSDNYRSIALSSLILKVFDYVILLLHGHELTTDELQFGYQKNISTNMCTWPAVEMIEYYQHQGSNVYGHD